MFNVINKAYSGLSNILHYMFLVKLCALVMALFLYKRPTDLLVTSFKVDQQTAIVTKFSFDRVISENKTDMVFALSYNAKLHSMVAAILNDR